MFTIANFASFHAAIGEIVESSRTEKESIQRVCHELRLVSEEDIRLLLLSARYYYELLKGGLKKWMPKSFTISHGEMEIVRRACLASLTDRGWSTLNFISCPVYGPAPHTDYELLMRSPGSSIFQAIDEGIFFELSSFPILHGKVSKAERVTTYEVLYNSLTSVGEVPEAYIGLVNETRDAVVSHLLCFKEGIYQMRLRRIRTFLLAIVTAKPGNARLGMSTAETSMRCMRLIGEIDAAINAMNDRSSSAKALADRACDAKAIRSFIRGNCATAKSSLPAIRQELKSIMLLTNELPLLAQHFPEFYSTLRSAYETAETKT